jgi:uncharacterized surface protein with fasciclin (FAS1) repeats
MQRFRRTTSALALPAALALAAAACDDNNGGASDEPLQFDESQDGGDADADDAAIVLPAGVFGEECQAILEEVDLRAVGTTDRGAAPGAGVQDDDGFGSDDDDAGFGSDDDDAGFGSDDDDAGFGSDDDDDAGFGSDDDDDAGFGSDDDSTVGSDDDNGVGSQDDTQTATTEQQRLRDMSTLEAVEAIPSLAHLADALRASGLSEQAEGGQLTVFAPIGEGYGPQTDTDMGTEDDTDDGTQDEDNGVGTQDEDNGVGTQDEDNGVGTQDEDNGVGTQDDDDAAGTDDGQATTSGTAGFDDEALKLHIVEDAVDAQRLVDDGSVETVGAVELTATVEGDTVSVTAEDSTAMILCASIETADGFIHVIDQPFQATTTDQDDAGTDDAGTDAGTDDPSEDDDADADDGAFGDDEDDDLDDDSTDDGDTGTDS